jgi:L-ascorbate metabolism protein UlaG (beta-lactamase superfamily)
MSISKQTVFFAGILLAMQVSGQTPSDHFDGKTYKNPWGVNNSKSFFTVLKWQLTGNPEPWPEHVDFSPQTLPARPSAGATVTWINHSTFLIQFARMNVLTDPVWSERVSPVSFLGPKRVHAPGLSLEQLPKIDYVLISHNHFDHLDVETLMALEQKHKPLFLVPQGDAGWLKKKGLSRVVEKDWWEKEHADGATFIFTPAQHWSARTLWDRNESLWGGWWIETEGLRLFHAGDSGLGPHFKMVRERLGDVDVALLPIGAFEPRWFMREMHMNPAEAVEAALILEAKTTIGMHFGTFQLTDEGRDRPSEQLQEALKSQPQLRFVVPAVGESFQFPVTRPVP